MSISVDDIGILEAFTTMDADAAHSGAPTAYIHAIRTGTPGSRHRITVNGEPAHITIGARPAASRTARDTADSFTRLRAAMTAATTDGIQPQLPPEISMVTWHHNGQELRLCAPGTAPTLRRARERVRHRLGALSPLPLLGALTQPLAGSATAVGIAIAPVMPPMDTTPPPAPAVVEILGGDIARPEPPHTPGLHLATPSTRSLGPLIPQPQDRAFAADTNPPPRTSDPAPAVTSPATTPAPGVSASPSPTDTPEPEVDSTTGPTPDTPNEDPTGTPTPSPPPAVTESPTSSHTPHRRGHGHRHNRHPHHRPSHGRH